MTSAPITDLTQQFERRRGARDYLNAVVRWASPLSQDNETARRIRAAVGTGDVTALRNTAASFVALVDESTLIGLVAPLAVPARVGRPVLFAPDGVTAYVVAEGAATPITQVNVSDEVVPAQTLRNIFPFPQRDLDSADPQVQRNFERTLIDLLAEAWDAVFAATLMASTEVDAGGNLADDLYALFAFVANGRKIRRPVLVTSDAGAAWLAGQANAVASRVPVLISPTLANRLVLFDAGRLAWADDGFELDRAREAAIEMRDDPAASSATPTGASAVISMFQTNTIALRCTRYLSWLFLSDHAVAHILIDAETGS